ncbi:MAG: acyl-CoA thioesterase [Phycisphaerales bacterium]|jgi:acyl-CoA thioester hydrolase
MSVEWFPVRMRVRYCECDPMGVAHHASYVPWMEIGRTEMLRATGRTYASMEEQDILLVIVKMEVRYRRPVKYDDVLEIRTRRTGGGRVKIEHEYEIAVVERAGVSCEEVAAVASTTLGCVGRDGKPRVLPDELIQID